MLETMNGNDMKVMKRREFLKTTALAAAAAALPGRILAANGRDGIRAVLLHVGHNLWCDWYPEGTDLAKVPKESLPDVKLRCVDALWKEAADHAVAKGLNMIVVDLAEGLAYPSHPELAIEGSWSAEKMSAEVRRLKGLGVEVIPKLNFSTTHDGWLKQYRRLVSTPQYYAVCADVLKDAYEIFGHPRFIHIGCDEEDHIYHIMTSKTRQFVLTRRGEVWKNDFLFYVRTVEKLGARAWCWSDYGWDHPDFHAWCPKSVVMSDWYYDEGHGGFDPKTNPVEEDRKRIAQYAALEAAGFDQIPCGTNWAGRKRDQEKCGADDVIGKLVGYCRRTIAPERLMGFMMASWAATDNEKNLAFAKRGIDLLAEALG